MDVSYFAKFGKLRHVYHTANIYSGFQLATAYSSEKVDCVITHLLKVIAITVILVQIGTENLQNMS